MPISLTCLSCGKKLKAKDSLAGKMVPCPHCGEKVRIPDLDEDAGAYALAPEAAPEPPPSRPCEEKTVDTPRPVRPEPKHSLPPLTTNEPPVWQRHLHWLLVLALVPLALSLLQKDSDEDFRIRLIETLQQAPPGTEERVERVLANLESGHGSVDDLFDALPDRKLAGAFLPRGTPAHWGFALGAAILFTAFFLLLSGEHTAEPLHLLGITLFTATIGIILLLLFQTLAGWSQGIWLRGGGIVALLFWIVKLIGFSYQAALDPANGFFMSFFGYTLGVGFCEEVCKALPLLVYFRRSSGLSWRGAFLWGLASGAGFGIAEGIMYSGSYYNGVSGPGIYVVRFVSCVALHALWTGSVGITLQQNQGMIQEVDAWYEFFPPVFLIVGIPMVLHGLYDTLLKREMNGAALGVAVLSFLYLAFQISRLHGTDDAAANEALLKEYQRRRSTMT